MKHHVRRTVCTSGPDSRHRVQQAFSRLPTRTYHFLVSMAATEGPIPTAEEKSRIMAARKELIQALVKRRALDKQLVR